jgi:predicted Zn-dependent peptidase
MHPSLRSRLRHVAGRALVLLAAGLVVAAAWAAPATAQGADRDLLDNFEEKVTEITLDNGLTVVVVERHDTPVVSFTTYIDVGSVNEPAGRTGLAHMFEHMAFKGTTSIGTKNIEKEMAALERQEEAYLKLRREKAKGVDADSARIERLQKQFEAAQEEAQSHIQEGEFENILERNGATRLNAGTAPDFTRYTYRLPANKLKLFFALEADRFKNPVLREFYTERDVVMEERRQRTESQPTGRLYEAFVTTAFKAHPYGQPTIGHMSDLKMLARTDAKDFYEKYYTASNMTVAVVGDVDPDRVEELAREYLGRLPEGEDPLPVTTEEPEQNGERRVVIREQTQPYVFMGYHRGSMRSPNDPVYDVLADVLTQGRTSRLYQRLQETGKALGVQAVPSTPGEKFDNLFFLVGVPNRGVSPDSIEQEITAELDSIKAHGITEAELERAKTRARASLVQSLDSDQGLANRIAQMENLTGDWRNVFRTLDEIEAVTVEDVQRVARETFRRDNRTVAMIKNSEGGGSGPTAAAGDGR